MNINHHLDDATLVSYSAGALSQGMALVVASHLSVCPQCRERAEINDAVGGVLLESLESETVADDMLASILSQLDDLPAEPRSAVAGLTGKTIDPEIPAPLREYIDCSLAQLEGNRIVPGATCYDMPWEGSGVARCV